MTRGSGNKQNSVQLVSFACIDQTSRIEVFHLPVADVLTHLHRRPELRQREVNGNQHSEALHPDVKVARQPLRLGSGFGAKDQLGDDIESQLHTRKILGDFGNEVESELHSKQTRAVWHEKKFERAWY